MLSHIAIRDFAIIDALELDLTTGMSVLTGETGAGKSILVDALGLVLGDRADTDVIRQGAERAEISAEFDLRALPDTNAWLKHNDLTADDACILRRVIGRDGRSRGLINGRSVPLQMLRELGEQLVDIHGQHEHQSLLRPAEQLKLLDAFGDHAALVDEVARLCTAWKAADEHLTALQAAAKNRDRQLELLRHQVSELDTLGLQPDELPGLDQEHRRLANSSKLLEGVQTILDELYENEDSSAYRSLHQALSTLGTLSELDPQLREITTQLSTTQVQLADASDGLRRYLNNTEMDPQRLEWLENRLGAIHDLARKHHVGPNELPVRLDKLRAELHSIENAEVVLKELETELAALRKQYLKDASDLNRRRTRVAADLGKKVTAVMQELGMPGGRFAIDITHEPERFSAKGTEQVEFQVSANKGQPLKALAKVASGGELSRIALAIQVVAAQTSAIPSMIFDEVDAGIGGGVAEIVGRRLRSLGEKRQVFCVTHLPQVASQAHQHFRVVKTSHGPVITTTVELLDRKNQVEELARMLGGLQITETTRKHAREMIARVEQGA